MTVPPDSPPPADPGTTRAFANAGAFLDEHMDTLVEELGELLREQLPAYGAEALDTVRSNIRETLDVALARLRRGEAPGPVEAAEIAARAQGWAAAGQPLDPRSFQLGARRLMALAAANAAALDLDDHALYALQDRVWAWATVCASALADAQREQEVAAARRDATHRADFLRDLADGRMTVGRLAGDAPVHGLDLEQPYVAVCGEAGDRAGVAALEVHVRRTGATSEHRGLQVVVDGGLLAVTPQPPTALEGTLVAVGPPVLLGDAHESFAEAREALTAARAFGVTGVVDLGSLGPLPLVTAADRLAARLEERHLAPLDVHGRAGAELAETVRTLLELDHSVEAAAARLHLHRNSIRYRVNRFTELTGLDLRRTDDLVTAWWLLERRRIRP